MRARAVFIVAVLALAGTASAAAQSSSKAPPQLDYDYFTKRVEPIFLAKRAGHARCYVCHAESNNTLRLEKLHPRPPLWTGEQAGKKFEAGPEHANPARTQNNPQHRPPP